jgi:hypothetical protein
VIHIWEASAAAGVGAFGRTRASRLLVEPPCVVYAARVAVNADCDAFPRRCRHRVARRRSRQLGSMVFNSSAGQATSTSAMNHVFRAPTAGRASYRSCRVGQWQ